MAAIQVKPGRARVNLKVWTHTMSTDMTGAHMSEEAAMLIYRIASGGKIVGPNTPGGILEGVLEAMQWADEIGGPEAAEYIAMMERIAAEATKRAQKCLATAQQVIDSHRTGDDALGSDAKATGSASHG